MVKRLRITLSMFEEEYQPFKELAEEMNKPAATLIRDLIVESAPRVKEILEAVRLAKGGSLVCLDKLDELANSFEADATKIKEGNAEIREKKKQGKPGKK